MVDGFLKSLRVWSLYGSIHVIRKISFEDASQISYGLSYQAFA
jgi:hypothetical protein